MLGNSGFVQNVAPFEDYGDYEEMLDCGEVENHEDYLNRWKAEYPDETGVV